MPLAGEECIIENYSKIAQTVYVVKVCKGICKSKYIDTYKYMFMVQNFKFRLKNMQYWSLHC